MKCGYSEKDIALFVERDLAQLKVREIEEHLETCDACRELAEELRETQSVFKSLKQDMVSAGALASVRTKVLAEVGAGNVKAGWGRWVYALAGAAFVAVMAIGVAQYMRKPDAQVQQVVKSDPQPAASQPAVPITRGTVTESIPASVIQKTRAKVKASVPLTEGVAPAEIPTEPPKQLVVKLLTEDPNIVIYWLVDQNGGAL